jgi:hypothetical protein
MVEEVIGAVGDGELRPAPVGGPRKELSFSCFTRAREELAYPRPPRCRAEKLARVEPA